MSSAYPTTINSPAASHSQFKMEHIPDELLNIAGLAIVPVALILVIQFFFFTDPEAAVPYDVAVPEQARPGWKGEVLEQPSLKVRGEV